MAAKSSLLRFSIRHLLVWTAFVALGCIALRGASGTWVAALLGVSVLTFAAAVFLLMFRQGPDRAYWIGFALMGWLYLILLMYGWSLDPNTSYNNPLRPSNLITGRLSTLCYNRLYSSSTPQYGMGGGIGTAGMMPGGEGSADGGYGGGMPALPGSDISVSRFPVPVATTAGPTQDDFLNVAHAFWALLLAACGGWFARWLWVGQTPTPQPADVESPMMS
jgi:hypothetical protein